MTMLSKTTSTFRCGQEQGLTLVELMVSILLGIFLSSGVVGVYLDSKRNYLAEEEMARIQENGRYTLSLLKRELMMAGFFGGVLQANQITPKAVTGDCDTNWALDGGTPLDIMHKYALNNALLCVIGMRATHIGTH